MIFWHMACPFLKEQKNFPSLRRKLITQQGREVLSRGTTPISGNHSGRFTDSPINASRRVQQLSYDYGGSRTPTNARATLPGVHHRANQAHPLALGAKGLESTVL
jgi:hypothetical protein